MSGALSRLVLLGATGDLAGRLLLPALARLIADGLDGGADGVVGDDLLVVGAAPDQMDDAAFARRVEDRLDAYAGDVPLAARRALVERLRYVRVGLEHPASVAEAVRAAGTDAPVAPAAGWSSKNRSAPGPMTRPRSARPWSG